MPVLSREGGVNGRPGRANDGSLSILLYSNARYRIIIGKHTKKMQNK